MQQVPGRERACRSKSSSNGLPFGAMTAAPAFTPRLASGISAVTTMSPAPARSAIQSSAASMPAPTTTRSIHGSRGTAIGLLLTTRTLQPVPLGHAIDLLLHRAGVGVDIDRDRSGLGHRLLPTAVEQLWVMDDRSWITLRVHLPVRGKGTLNNGCIRWRPCHDPSPLSPAQHFQAHCRQSQNRQPQHRGPGSIRRRCGSLSRPLPRRDRPNRNELAARLLPALGRRLGAVRGGRRGA